MGYLKNTINTQRAILIPIPSSGKADAPIPDISTKFKFFLDVSSVAGNVIDILMPITDGNNVYDTLHEAGLKIGMVLVDDTTKGSSVVVNVTDTTLTVRDASDFTGSKIQAYGGFQNGALVYIGEAGTGASPSLRVITSGGDDVTFKGLSSGDVLPVQVTRIIAVSEEMTDLIALW